MLLSPESSCSDTPSPPGMPPCLRVGLVLQTGQAHMRAVSRGVYQYLRGNRRWRIVGAGQYPLLQWDELPDWRGDGLIAIPNTAEQFETLLGMRVPVVNAGSRFVDPRLTTVACDNELIGKLAAEHLLGCRLRHFAFVSELAWEDERRRCRAFADTMRAVGCSCEVIQLPFHEELAADASARYRVDVAQLGDALQRLPLPVGVCVPNSVAARIVSDVAQECGLDVPDQVAVLGVNDDPLVCESTNPHLSAVVQPSERIGLEAARRLDMLMSGAERTPTTEYLPPQGIAARQSTDTLAIADVAVRLALRFIRAHAAEPIEVSDVIEAAGVSRRTLETRFRRLLGRTPAFELRRVRMQLAKRLLAETNEPITNIVYASGFNSRQVFCALFRKETGDSPTAYRRRFQSEIFGGNA